jgi:hypothetical protein
MTAADLAHALLRALVPVGAALARADMARRRRRFVVEQQALRARYGVGDDTPIVGYDDDTRSRILALAAADARVRLATTSGSTGAPKQLAYPPARVASYARDSAAIAVQAFAWLRLPHPSLFVLASEQEDDSFASLVLHRRRRRPPFFAGVVEPSRHLRDPVFADVIARHGLNAARLLLLTLTDPGLLYATNPSTLAGFFADLEAHWPARVAAIDDWRARQHEPAVRAFQRRAGVGDVAGRLQAVLSTTTMPPPTTWLPSLRGWVGWDGGYVTAFLPTVHGYLPPDRVRQVPMYSMSTEVIETLTVFVGSGGIVDDDDEPLAWLPLGPGVLVELLPEEDGVVDAGSDDPRRLIRPGQAEPGRVYSLVVSDPWGLRRYQTDDLFVCRRLVDGLPDLRFLRRRGLAWSFTGEKLTGEQVQAALDVVRARFPTLPADVERCCFPTQPTTTALPGYVLVLAPTTSTSLAAMDAFDVAAVAAVFDEALAAQNAEWRAKRQSGRLAPTRAVVVPHEALAMAYDRRTDGEASVAARAWESQFKLTPLVKRRWEDVAARLPS